MSIRVNALYVAAFSAFAIAFSFFVGLSPASAVDGDAETLRAASAAISEDSGWQSDGTDLQPDDSGWQ
ncbi:hypothetical protein [Nocardiopsis quinghaiensis]|uniref:hypothetical protein n=1 Tax=Nocardiopsis quinghaiensis TaxID=464995 RepID=UPI00123BD2DA|nr:hypothetical protein [Nocardiopsis quinghaiensis]